MRYKLKNTEMAPCWPIGKSALLFYDEGCKRHTFTSRGLLPQEENTQGRWQRLLWRSHVGYHYQMRGRRGEGGRREGGRERSGHEARQNIWVLIKALDVAGLLRGSWKH